MPLVASAYLVYPFDGIVVESQLRMGVLVRFTEFCVYGVGARHLQKVVGKR